MDPEEFPVGFDPEAEEPSEDVPEGFPQAAEPVSISEEELQERLAEMGATCSGPQCASSVLATRYAKILRQERLLAMAANVMQSMEVQLGGAPLTAAGEREAAALSERSAAIRREVDKERKEKA